MSTRFSTVSPNPVSDRPADGMREFQPARREEISRSRRPDRNTIFRADSMAVSSLLNPELGFRATVNEKQPAQMGEGVRSVSWLRSTLTARDLMRACEATLRPEDSIERAARVMSETDSSAVPVVDGDGRLIGIITGRDIAMKLIAMGTSIPHAQVSDCMTREVFACSVDNSLESCVSAMCWHQVRRIPIVDDEHRVLGTISQRDLARYMCEHPERVERQAMADILWALAN